MLKILSFLVITSVLLVLLMPASAIIPAWSFLLLAGILITGTLLRRTEQMVMNRDGNQIMVNRFTLKAIAPLQTWLASLPDRSIGLLIKWLKIDYLFMLFLYPFLEMIVIKLTVHPEITGHFGRIDWKLLMLCLVVFTACMDILENWFAIWYLEGPDKYNSTVFAGYMRFFSFGKWIGSGLLAILFLILILIKFSDHIINAIDCVVLWFK